MAHSRRCGVSVWRAIRAEMIEKHNDFIHPHGTTIAFELAERRPEITINWSDGVRNRPPTEEGLKLASCGKAIYSDDLTFVGGTHSAKLSIVGGDKKQEVTENLPGLSVNKTSTSYMGNFLKAAAGIEP